MDRVSITQYGSPLTLTEIETMRKLASGVGVKKIAREEGVSPNAVRGRVYRASIKLGTQGHICTIMMAYRLGHFQLPPVDPRLS